MAKQIAGDNADGAYYITDVEQEGSVAGQRIGRIWIRTNNAGCSSWRWIGIGSVGQAARQMTALRAMTAPQVDAWYESQ